MEENKESESLPVAILVDYKKFNWFWLIPLCTILVCIVILYQILQQTGIEIEITAKQGHGLKAGAPIRCKGIDIGLVNSVQLSKDFKRVIIKASIEKNAQNVINTGSRFWIEYPRINISGIGGLDTIAGPRYISVIPGRGKIQKKFIALDEAPADQLSSNKHLEITITAKQREGIHSGSPIFYRQIEIGKVLSVNLANDSTAVLFRASIHPAYALLVRKNSLFYIKSGASFKMGLKGFQFNADSLQTILKGGIHLVVPEKPSEPVASGSHFSLSEEENDAWEKWQARIPTGSQLLPPNTSLPNMKKLFAKSKGVNFWNSDINRKIWVLVENNKILFFDSFIKNKTQALNFEFEGKEIQLNTAALSDSLLHPSDKLVSYSLPKSISDQLRNGFSKKLLKRKIEHPENTLIMTESPQSGIALSKNNIHKTNDGRWKIDASVPLHMDQNGAAILSRTDGALVGLLQFDAAENAFIFPVIK